jgi:hypothetical protein
MLDDKDLIADLLPDESDRNATFDFAMSFDGYEHYGSLEKCADAAKSKARETLADLRNELFFEARASRHRNDDEFLLVYSELLPLIRAKLSDSS